MTILSENWITEGRIDFELKKYVLLAYEQHVKGQFREKKLFPGLKDAQKHYQNCIMLHRERNGLKSALPKDLVSFDLQQMKAIFGEIYRDSPEMLEIDDILMFSIPVLSGIVEQGRELKNEAYTQLNFGPVGILPLRNDEGYLFLYRMISRETSVYEYRITLFAGQKERLIRTRLVDTVSKSLSTTFENLKVNLTRKYTHLPNPAAYVVESRMEYPVEEALLPLAKELMLRELNYT